MEALIFLTDAIAVVILVIASLKNDKLLPGQPMTGLFRYRDPESPAKTKPRRGRA